MKWVLLSFSFGALWLVLLAGAVSSLVSCGPSKEEIEAQEKFKKDSTQAALSLLLLEGTATVTSAEPDYTVRVSPKQYSNNADFRIGIYSVNGCEYVSFGLSSTASVVHAGNCNNPIHHAITTHTVVERDNGRPY